MLRKDEKNAAEIRNRTRQFMELFFSCYERSVVTPYLHIFAAHLHEFKEINNTINNFNLQGLEKLNDLTTMQFFKATNKRKTNRWRKTTADADAFNEDDSPTNRN